VTLALSTDEAEGLRGCVIEALNALRDPEFSTRVGLTRDEADGLLARINEALRGSG
jgi:hypothetical protein